MISPNDFDVMVLVADSHPHTFSLFANERARAAMADDAGLRPNFPASEWKPAPESMGQGWRRQSLRCNSIEDVTAVSVWIESLGLRVVRSRVEGA